MTEPHDAASVLPLSVTCSPDDRLADALRALVGRVGTLAGDAAQAQPFVTAVERVVAWVLAHPDAVAGDVALIFDRDGDRLHGDLRWGSSNGRPALPEAAAVRSTDVDVACDVEGAQVRCRVSCRCA